MFSAPWERNVVFNSSPGFRSYGALIFVSSRFYVHHAPPELEH